MSKTINNAQSSSGVTSKIFYTVMGVLLVSLITLSATSLYISTNVMKDNVKSLIETEGQTVAAQVEQILSSKIEVARVIAHSFEGMKKSGSTTREAYGAILKSNLEYEPSLLGVWTAWEPNALDSKDAKYKSKGAGHDATGRYVPYYYRSAGKIALEPLISYDVAGDGDYYQLSLKSGKETILEPYWYEVGGVNTLITSLVVPIREGGKVIGVAGVDLALSDIQKMLASIKPLDKGYVNLVTDNGNFAAHLDANLFGKSIATGAYSPDIIAAIKAGQSYIGIETLGKVEKVRASTPLTIGKTGSKWAVVAVVNSSDAFGVVSDLTMLLIISAMVIIIGAGIIAIIVSARIGSPISNMTNFMQNLAGGDLDSKVPGLGSKGFIGGMANAAEVFKNNAIERQNLELAKEETAKQAHDDKKIMMSQLADNFQNQIQGIIESVSVAANELYETAGSMGVQMVEASEKSTEVAGASVETSSNVQSVASAAEEMSASVREIAHQIATTNSSVIESADKANYAFQSAEALQKASESIGEIAQMIENIAGQINLLALNATIESARAGEAGKGFAVVANEVKNLANQTAKATEEIGKEIANVQSVSTAVVEALTSMQDSIETVSVSSSAVASAVEEQATTTNEISSNMQLASQNVENISAGVDDIANATGQANITTLEVQKAAKSLSEKSELLDQEVQKFLSDVRAS